MANTSIGQFIAALRKANGMTQQEVADRLNVSNKAVSRWERDESYPDISLIPPLAELLGVTCDELLKGERISETDVSPKREIKIEKQVKNLISRTLSGFKTLIWIALAVAAVGLVCMLGISYGLYLPVIGFAVMLLFEACSFAITALAVIRTKDVKTDNELFEAADETLTAKFNHTLGSYSFISFFTIFSAIWLSLTLVFNTSSYIFSVLGFGSYSSYFVVTALLLIFIFLRAKKPFEAWITNTKREKVATLEDKALCKMNLLQIGATALAAVIFIYSPYLIFSPNQSSALPIAANMLGLALLVISIVVFIVFAIKNKAERKGIILTGLRNSLLSIPALVLSGCHDVGFEIYDVLSETPEFFSRYDSWNEGCMHLSLLLALFITVAFDIIKLILSKRNKRPSN